MIQARDYQIEARDSIPRYFCAHSGNPLVCMPTGTGKSVVIAMFLQYVFQWAGQRVLIATHVKELVQQNYDKLMAVWPQAPAGIYSSGLRRRDKFMPITFVGIASVAKRAHEFGKVDLLMIDEAHLVSPTEDTNYRKFIEALKVTNPALKVIGLTATPWRLGFGSLCQEGSIFTDICFDITGMEAFNRLIKEGYLSTLVPKRTNALIDIKGVGKQGGEFKSNELQAAVDKPGITRAALAESTEIAVQQNRQHWLVFCAGVEHCIHTAQMLNDEFGVRAVAIHSKMGDAERDKAIELFKSGYYTAAVNNNVLTTGFDFPGIDMIVMLRPTASAVLWVQMLGRGTRPVYADGFDLMTTEGRLAAIAAGPKQDCLVLDFARNTVRLGPINDPVPPRKKGEGGGEAPVKECPNCFTYNHASARQCFKCGCEFTFQTKLVTSAGTNELIKQDIPITETFAVDQITFSKHQKAGKAPSMQVTYYCGLRSFRQWVPLEGMQGRGLAQRWWNERARNFPMPATVDDALSVVSNLPAATHIRVWTNKQYPEIIACCYDGTNFNTEPAPTRKQVEVRVSESLNPWKKVSTNSSTQEFDNMEDDIPF
jgi:DNA repair protein RadD